MPENPKRKEFLNELEDELLRRIMERDLSLLSPEDQLRIIEDKIAYHPNAITPTKEALLAALRKSRENKNL